MLHQKNMPIDAYHYLALRIFSALDNALYIPKETLEMLGFKTAAEVDSLNEETLYQKLLELQKACGITWTNDTLKKLLAKDRMGGIYQDFINHHKQNPPPSAPPPETNHANQAGGPTTQEDIADRIVETWYFIGSKLRVNPHSLETIRRGYLMDTKKGAQFFLSHLIDKEVIEKNISPVNLWQILSPYNEQAIQFRSENPKIPFSPFYLENPWLPYLEFKEDTHIQEQINERKIQERPR